MRIPKLLSTTLDGKKFVLQFETGERRYFYVEELIGALNNLNVGKFSVTDLKKSRVDEHGILTFPTVQIELTTAEGTNRYPYDLDPDYIYHSSISEETSIGQIFKEMRLSQSLTQEDVAERCNTTRGYISKFENDSIQVEWNTLRKLFFLGLGVKINPTKLISPLVPVHSAFSSTRTTDEYIHRRDVVRVEDVYLSFIDINWEIKNQAKSGRARISKPWQFELEG